MQNVSEQDASGCRIKIYVHIYVRYKTRYQAADFYFFNFTFIYLCFMCVCARARVHVHIQVLWCKHGSQRMISRRSFSFPSKWVPEMETTSLGLAVSTFTH